MDNRKPTPLAISSHLIIGGTDESVSGLERMGDSGVRWCLGPGEAAADEIQPASWLLRAVLRILNRPFLSCKSAHSDPIGSSLAEPARLADAFVGRTDFACLFFCHFTHA